MYQKIIIVGNLGRDPEMRFTPSGTAVTSFSVATSRQWTDNEGNKVKETTWFKISAWNKQAETCNNFLRKGSKVLIEGQLVPDKNTGSPKIWTRNDGTPGASFEVRANNVRFLDSKSEATANIAEEPGEAPADAEDEIPF